MGDVIQNKCNITAGKKYQEFVNSKLPSWHLPLKVDGWCGRMTTAATYVVFQQKNAKKVTDAEIDAQSKRLGESTSTRVRTVAAVETRGSGWDSFGFPSVLYEQHYFWDLTKGRTGITDFANPNRSKKYYLDADKDNINDSWEKVAAASLYDARAAFCSISVSKFQIMGKWYDKLGFDEPWEMAYAVANDEAIHYQLMVNWIILNNQLKAFRALSGSAEACRAFAKFWNGGAYATHNYHGRLASSYLKYKKIYG